MAPAEAQRPATGHRRGDAEINSAAAVSLSTLPNPVDQRFEAAHAVYFLDHVFGNVNSGRLGLSYSTPSGGIRSEHFQWLRFGVAQAQRWDAAQPAGIYFRATMLPPEGVKSGRGGEAESHALAFLWADVDYGTTGHKPPPNGLPLPPDEEAARKIITTLPTPSLIINSGGGLYPLWVYRQPIYLNETKRAEAKTRSQRWQNLIAAKAAEFGWHYGSGVGDLARVLRLPGSVNRKEGLERPCRVTGVSGEVLTW